MDKSKIAQTTLSFLQEVTANGFYDKDIDEENEMAINLCHEMNLSLDTHLHEVLTMINNIAILYCYRKKINVL